jgi:3-methyladenine DNA glycosylase AlkD
MFLEMKATRSLDIAQLRAALKGAADPARAPAMQAYMKSSMPYYGVAAPVLRRVISQQAAGIEFATPEEWRRTILRLWRDARYREERYAAVELCLHRKVDSFQTPAALPMYEEMIVTGAWWDFVDTIASNCVGKLLQSFPREISREMRSWSRCENIWKRRTSILSV